MKTSLAGELSLGEYRVEDSDLLTPALVIYPELVRHNIERMISLLGEQPSHWRPHLKTVKLGSMTRLLTEANVRSAKCATTLELRMACESGMEDVLVAYPHTGATAKRISTIAEAFPEVRISIIVESKEQIEDWINTRVDLFIDLNTGMDRTGIQHDEVGNISDLASRIQAAGLTFRGLHFYDGHANEQDLAERTKKAHKRYDDLLGIVDELEGAGIRVEEVITSGTPGLPCAVVYPSLWRSSFTHQVSPGTVVYNDASSLEQLPEAYGFRLAALVISQVVSHPKPKIATCDAGHKSVSVDSGVPNCLVLGRPELKPLKPSEEHLPMESVDGSGVPELGSMLYLLPRHVCPTVNNFDRAAIVRQGRIVAVEPVTARGREGPLAPEKDGKVVASKLAAEALPSI